MLAIVDLAALLNNYRKYIASSFMPVAQLLSTKALVVDLAPGFYRFLSLIKTCRRLGNTLSAFAHEST